MLIASPTQGPGDTGQPGCAAGGTAGDTGGLVPTVTGGTGISPDLHHHEAEPGLEGCHFLTHLLWAPALLALSAAHTLLYCLHQDIRASKTTEMTGVPVPAAINCSHPGATPCRVEKGGDPL